MLPFKDLIFDLPQAHYTHEGKVLNSMRNMHQAFPPPNELLVFTCQITSHFLTSKSSSTGVREQSLQRPQLTGRVLAVRRGRIHPPGQLFSSSHLGLSLCKGRFAVSAEL